MMVVNFGRPENLLLRWSMLEYNKWGNFHKVISRAMIACENGGHIIADDFPEVRKIVNAGATSKPVKDYELTRYVNFV